MSGTEKTDSGDAAATGQRELELRLAKARAEAEEARLRAEVAALEAELAQAQAAEPASAEAVDDEVSPAEPGPPAEEPAPVVTKQPRRRSERPQPEKPAGGRTRAEQVFSKPVRQSPKAAPAATSQPTQEKETEAEGEAPAAEAPKSPLARWLRNSSGWLLSALVHMVMVVVLGIISISFSDEGLSGIFLNATADAETPDELEDIAAEIQAEDLEIEDIEALPVRLEDIGMAAIGDLVSQAELQETGNVSISNATDPMADLGALFGDDGKGFADQGDGTGGAQFFGVKAGGNKFVFVVDGSKSMAKNGWEPCKYELVQAVRRLKPKQYFYVILFAAKPYMMFGPGNEEPMLVEATPENFSRLERWLSRYELQLGTKPQASIEKALAMYPDAIYFLTDGKIQDDTEGYLKENNKKDDLYDGPKTRVAVHTIGFFTLDGAEVLKRISEHNDGTFRYVAEPPGYKKFQQQKKKMAAGGKK